MIEVEEAVKIILSHCPATSETEVIEIENAFNRVLAEDIYAKDPLPPFPASIKDGYAVKAIDGPGVRMVRQSVAAGDEVNKNFDVFWFWHEDNCETSTYDGNQVFIIILRISLV